MPRATTHPPFERLHWRLMRAYILVTVGATLLFGIIVMARLTYVLYFTSHTPEAWVLHAEASATRIAPDLQAEPPDLHKLNTWVEQERRLIRNAGQQNAAPDGDAPQLTFTWNLNPAPRNIGIAVVNRAGIVVASTALNVLNGKPISEFLDAREDPLVIRALGDERDISLLGITDKIGLVSAAAPVHDSKGNVVGALFVRVRTLLTLSDWLIGFGSLVLLAALFITCAAVVFGSMFSFLTARGLTQRLQVMASASDAWSRGDFTPKAEIQPKDELGELGARLNGMARDLSQLLDLRQSLAGAEERNRLARDLHDTVKQQAFAAAMQIGAARAKLATSAVNAGEHLDEAAAIVARIQQDLAGILSELSGERVQREIDVLSIIQQRITAWSRQTSIDASVDIRVEGALPVTIAKTLLAIIDEAVSNVARHSNAHHLILRLTRAAGNPMLELSISDDGAGLASRTGATFALPNTGPEASSGMGLRNMRSRAESLPGGTFELESTAEGVRITVICRVSEGENDE